MYRSILFNVPRCVSIRKNIFYGQRNLSTTFLLRDYYKLLGVGRTASKNEIKMAYFQMAKKYHPDANPGDIHAKEKFQQVAEAYSVLSDDSKRSLYDSRGWNEQQQAQNQRDPFSSGYSPPNVDPHEVFRQMFEDLGVQDVINRIEKGKSEILDAANAAAKGDWSLAKTFASNHKVLMFGVMVPLILAVRFPGLIAAFVRAGTVGLLSFLTLIARNPRLAAIAGRALYQRYIIAAQRAAAKNRSSKTGADRQGQTGAQTGAGDPTGADSSSKNEPHYVRRKTRPKN